MRISAPYKFVSREFKKEHSVVKLNGVEVGRAEFVVMAGARARQLLAGSTPRVAAGEHKKITIAQQEVITKAVEKIENEPGEK